MGDYYEEKLKRSSMSYKICFWSFVIALIMAMCLCFASCSTKSMVETETQYHQISELTSKMDSLFHSTSTWQKSIFEKQTALVDSFRQSEVRDTSRTTFLNEKGDTIKEKIVITKIIEREHTSSESTQEYYQELFKQTDSLLQSNKVLQTKMDSLLVIIIKKPWSRKKFLGIRNYGIA